MKRFVLTMCCVVAVVTPLWAQGGKDLASLIQEGDRKEALRRIRAGADLNQRQPNGTSPLHWAVSRVDYELIEELLKRGAKPSVINEFGSTPIAEAAELDDARMVKMLLDAGAEPEGADADHQTALMLAVKAGNLQAVQMLVNAGANVNNVETFHNQTPLMWAAAASRNASAMVDLLLSKGADVKPRALFRDWPSQISSEPRAQYRPVGGLTALLYASRNGCYECVQSLIRAGTDVNVPTPEGVSALMIAIDNGDNDVAKLLLENGAKPGVWDWWGRTALYIAVDRKNAGGGGAGGRGGGNGGAGRATARGGRPTVSDMEIITLLLDKGVDPNVELNMHRPSRGGNSGRFAENQLSTGATPLFRAVQGNDVEVIRLLLAHGANPNINAMGFTPFLLAAGVGPGGRGGGGGAANRTVLDLMLQHGAGVNAKVTGTETYSMRVSRAPSNNEGTTALHTAAQHTDADLVKYLLDHGADPNILDSEGRKPIDVVGLVPSGRGGAGTGAAKGNGQPPAGSRGGGGLTGPGGGRGSANQEEIRELLKAAMAK